MAQQTEGTGKAQKTSGKDRSDHTAPGAKDELPEHEAGLSEEESQEVEERLSLRAAVLYEIIRVEGEGELSRSFAALWWSGLAAGLSIGLSLVSEALLATHLPETSWKPLIENMGYGVGFIVVIMARQQLFTENTLTAVLPVIVRRRMKWLLIMLRLWIIVLFANLIGSFVFAATIAYTAMLPAGVAAHIVTMSEQVMANTPVEMFVKGIAAGWLIAALVWVLPSAKNNEFFVIGLLTYLVALGEFTHVIANSVEAFYLWIRHSIGAGDVFLHFMLPTLAGNVLGGTVLFGVLSYAQVRTEITRRRA